MNLTKSDVDRFWKRVSVRSKSDCWNWNGYKDAAGYGKFQLNHVPVYAHRVAVTITIGEIPEGMVVCHKCDNPSCCNPSHLFTGTQADNIADRDNKGKTPFLGEHNPNTAKLTETQVREIRNRYKTGEVKQVVLAQEYGIGKAQVNRIIHGKHWAWIEQEE